MSHLSIPLITITHFLHNLKAPLLLAVQEERQLLGDHIQSPLAHPHSEKGRWLVELACDLEHQVFIRDVEAEG